MMRSFSGANPCYSICRDRSDTTPRLATITWSSTPILAGLDEALRDRDVFVAGLGVSRGMVVHEDDRGRGGHDRGLEHLARVNDRGVERADRHGLLPDYLVPGVEDQHQEMLALLLAEPASDHRHDVLGAADRLRGLAAIAALRQFCDVHVQFSTGAERKELQALGRTWSPWVE